MAVTSRCFEELHELLAGHGDEPSGRVGRAAALHPGDTDVRAGIALLELGLVDVGGEALAADLVVFDLDAESGDAGEVALVVAAVEGAAFGVRPAFGL